MGERSLVGVASMKTQHPHARRRRAQGALAVVTLLVGLLGVAFFRVQVLGSSTYMLQAESNRLRALPIPAPRGTIFDRNGRIIADNVPGYAVTVIYERRDSVRATLERLRPYLGLTDKHIAELMRRVDRYLGQPLVVDPDADFGAVSRLQERRSEFPEVFIEMRPKRRYVSGPAISHVIGYVGEITADELLAPGFQDERYEQGMYVGKTGVERQYESILQGEQGVRYVEVDARGRVVGDFGGSILKPGTSGGDIRVNVDIELQEWIHRIFPEGFTGAVVALDPADGGVLALYSAPTFDPNDFVGGIDTELWRQLNVDSLKPLYNRAVLGKFPPASAFKPVVAAMALDLGVITPEQRMPIPCTGGLSYGGLYRRCWRPEGHGFLDLAGAIQHSCDVYFYQVGLKIGLDRFLAKGLELGLDERCGIDLPQETEGTFPESRDFWNRRFGYTPREGEVISMAIGQGPNSQTPLKMAQFFVAMARDGSAPAPSLFQGRADQPEGWDLDLAPEHLEALRQGLRQVTGAGGTAYMSSLEHWDMIGKTGTAENARSKLGLGETDAWFGGMAGPRGGPPEIVLIAMVEQGGGGSAVAAPIVAKAADFYLRKKYGIPVDTIQTLREHLMTRGWPTWASVR